MKFVNSLYLFFFFLCYNYTMADDALKDYTIAFVDFEDDKRYNKWGIHPVDIRSKFSKEKRALSGARLGIIESEKFQRLTKVNFLLKHIQFKTIEEFFKFFSEGQKFFDSIILDVEHKHLSALKNQNLFGKNIIYFNVSEGKNDLRNKNCLKNFFHTYASNLMLTDAVSQYLIEKKWNKVLLLTGPLDEDLEMSNSFKLSAKKFGLKITDEKFFVDNNDPRIRDKNDLSFLTSGKKYNSLFISDVNGEFSLKVPNATRNPSIVTGSSGLIAKLWHWSNLRHGAPQLNGRFEREFGRRMEGKDWAAWIAVKTLVEATLRVKSVDNEKIISYIRSENFRLDGSKGISINYRNGSNQLRQPVLLISGNNWVTDTAPLESFSDRKNNLDTLGYKSEENICK